MPKAQVADPVDLPRLLRLSSERRKGETDRENDREPDQPHSTSVKDGWRESNRRLVAGVGRVGRACLVDYRSPVQQTWLLPVQSFVRWKAVSISIRSGL